MKRTVSTPRPRRSRRWQLGLAALLACVLTQAIAHADDGERGDGERGDGGRGPRWDHRYGEGEGWDGYRGWGREHAWTRPDEEPRPERDGGHWFHGDHEGDFGWWWVINGVWALSRAPAYAVAPPPGPVVVPGEPAPPSPPPRYWYYCDSAGAYYPYVQSCNGGWRPVPAQ